ncbi:hypothetical protein [Armatimonas sp.]|uniref:hypothetical protein n=1 Tax=Armatimonas sp. TaxID=1872638 RepID=UPI0037533A4A
MITAIDLEKNTVTVQRENVEITYTFLPTVSLDFYRLSDDTHTVDCLDMRVAGAICSVFSVRLSD